MTRLLRLNTFGWSAPWRQSRAGCSVGGAVSVGAGVAVDASVGSGEAVGAGVGSGEAVGVEAGIKGSVDMDGNAGAAVLGEWSPLTDSSTNPSAMIKPHAHRFIAPILQSFNKMRNKKPKKAVPFSGFCHGIAYQMLMRFSGAMYILSVSVTPKASYHSGKFRGDMFALSSPGE